MSGKPLPDSDVPLSVYLSIPPSTNLNTTQSSYTITTNTPHTLGVATRIWIKWQNQMAPFSGRLAQSTNSPINQGTIN